MALSEKEMTISIRRRYGIIFPDGTKEKTLIDVMAGKYSKPEIVNLSKGRKAGKFSRYDLSSISTSGIKRFIIKYKKKVPPSGLSRGVLENILLGKVNVDKLSEKDLAKFGRKDRSILANTIAMYAGWIPKVRKKAREKDVKRGKKAAKKY